MASDPALSVARCEDPALLARLHGQCFSDGWSESSCLSLLKSDHNHCHCLYAGDQAVGFLVTSRIFDQAEIVTIGVLPSSRGLGGASFLVTTILADLANSGFGQVFLEVRADNHSALSLYERHGFKRHGLRKNYYKPDGDRIRDAIICLKNLVDYTNSGK